jgi:organic radical activating enzyme
MQGEGIDTGMPTVFVRLAGCSMGCSFCDEGKDTLSHSQVEDTHLVELVKKNANKDGVFVKNVVITGGEPLEQDIIEFVKALKRNHFRVGIETNGSIELGDLVFYFDVVSLSPKVAFDKCKVTDCTNLKILFPYIKGITAESYKDLRAQRRYIQPIWESVSNKKALKEVERLGYPWRLGLQVHKYIGLQ